MFDREGWCVMENETLKGRYKMSDNREIDRLILFGKTTDEKFNSILRMG